MNTFIEQIPEIEGNWLYKEEDTNRLFAHKLIRPITSDPWLECTDAEKQAWEQEHNTENNI